MRRGDAVDVNWISRPLYRVNSVIRTTALLVVEYSVAADRDSGAERGHRGNIYDAAG